jgi:hypothetical protein
MTAQLRAAALTAVAASATGLAALRAARDWGAAPAEVTAVLPGDELVAEPADTTTMAVDVEAPAREVWRWLAQMGQDRAGMYSYDLLENLVGLDIHSADRVHEEWQDLAVGDRVVVVPRGWGPLPDGYAMTVARLERDRLLVLRQQPPEHPWDAVWTFLVEPLGPTSCRLVSRSRAQRPASRALRVADAVMAPVTALMTRRMLLGIKRRAERAVWPAVRGPGALPPPRPVEDRATALDAPGPAGGGAR